jgi:hypothetical protein
MRRILICIPLLAVWLLTEVQGQQCTQIGSCDACLRLPLGCKWCSDQAFSGSRCLPITDNATKCNSGFENPTIETEYLEVCIICLLMHHFLCRLQYLCNLSSINNLHKLVFYWNDMTFFMPAMLNLCIQGYILISTEC